MNFLKKIDQDLGRFWPFWIAILVISIGMTFFNISADALWYDESYSVATVTHSMGDILKLVSTDSHPPLYYILLRVLVVLFGNSLSVIRGLSALASIGTVVLAYVFLRKRWGSPGALAFAVLFIITPMAIGAAQEARMYSLASFFVTGMVLAGYAAATDNRLRDWVALGVFAFAATWTHYFALMAAGLYWCLLFIKILITPAKQGEKKLARGTPLFRCLVVGGAVIVLFLPWVFALANQASRVAKNFWIQPLNLWSVFAILTFPFGQRFGGPHGMTSFYLFIAVHLIVIVGIVRALLRKDREVFLPLSAFLVYWLTFAGGVFLSWAIRPIFVERYLITCMGSLILAFAFFAHSFGKNRVLIALCAVYLFFTFPILKSTYTMQVNGAGDIVAKEYADRVKPDDIFVHGSEHTFGILRYYFPDNFHYLYIPADFIPMGNHQVFQPNVEIGSDLAKYTKEPVTIWAVSRTGEYYPTPWAELTEAPFREPAGPMLNIRKEPGWLTILLQEVRYNPDKTEKGSGRESGYLTVKVTDIDESLGGQLVYALYASDPIRPGNFINSGALTVTKGSQNIILENIPYGEYAIVAFHDLNGNYQPDFKNNKAVEGLAMGVNPAELKGEPSFDQLKFSFSENVEPDNIRMYYPE
ncbi:MAG TPA: glycosyltransferase family 39 protein [Treponemataceae bacterium]|jgi:uncharacterized protein (DUF2141 family)|nr:glycosyltransferase family 39 protein [Treponemataceae bacterium]